MNSKFQPIFCGFTYRDVSGFVGNPEDRFSYDAAHISYSINRIAYHIMVMVHLGECLSSAFRQAVQLTAPV